VGLEVLRLYQEGGILENGQSSGEHFKQALETLLDHPLVGDVRSRGLLAGIELVTNKAAKTKPGADLRVPQQLFDRGYANGITFRAFADSIIGLAPPLTISTDEVDLLIGRLTKTLDDLLEVKEIRNALN
jgi:adenosylmethionine-8-amino-7-oxononanoate aminotransferase